MGFTMSLMLMLMMKTIYESDKKNEKAGGTSATEPAERAKEPAEEQDEQERQVCSEDNISRIVMNVAAQGQHGGRGDDSRALAHLVQRVDHRGVPHPIPGGQKAFIKVTTNPVSFKSPPLPFLDLATTKRRCLPQNQRSRSSTSQRSQSRCRRALGCRRSRGTPSQPSSARPPPLP